MDWIASQASRVSLGTIQGVPIRDIIRDAAYTGSGYALIGGRGPRARLYWRPAQWMQRVLSSGDYRSWDGTYDKDDVFEFQFFPDPHPGAVRGRTPVTTLVDEVATDKEAADFVLTMLRTRGTPWALVTPDPAGRPLRPEDRDNFEGALNTLFQKANRGLARILPFPAKLEYPKDMFSDLVSTTIRSIPEERITAVFHVAASVIGLGTGLEQTKVGATMAESRRLSWQDGVVPVLTSLVAQLREKLGITIEIDYSGIEEMAHEANAFQTRVLSMLSGSIITVSRAQELLEQPIDTAANVYMVGGEVVPWGELDTLVPDLNPDEPLESPEGEGGAQEAPEETDV